MPNFSIHTAGRVYSHSDLNISKIGATRCQILKLKCATYDFRFLDAAWGAYSAPSDLVAVLMGATFKRIKKERKKKEERTGKEEQGKWVKKGR